MNAHEVIKKLKETDAHYGEKYKAYTAKYAIEKVV
jgi:hypothetical protein